MGSGFAAHMPSGVFYSELRQLAIEYTSQLQFQTPLHMVKVNSVARVITEKGEEEMEEKAEEKAEAVVGERIIPIPLSSTLHQLTYIGDPGTPELGRIKKAAFNHVPADAADIFIAGKALLELAAELTRGNIQMGLPAARAKAQTAWIHQAGAALLKLL